MTDISYKGGNCVMIQTKQATVVVDPGSVGAKDLKGFDKASVQLVSQPQFGRPAGEGQLVFSLPGEYETADVSIAGLDAASQLDPQAKSIIYRVTTGDCAVAVAGHINPDSITEDQLEQLGVVDILIVPVGGNGYTVDPHGAVKLTQHISPKIVIPVHYLEDGVAYEVPQLSVEQFIKELGQPADKQPTLKIKQPSQLPETLTLVQLEKTT